MPKSSITESDNPLHNKGTKAPEQETSEEEKIRSCESASEASRKEQFSYNPRPSFIDRAEKYLFKAFGWIPFFHYLVGLVDVDPKCATSTWEFKMDKLMKECTKNEVKTGVNDYKESIRARGVFNLRNVFDVCFFGWVTYVDRDEYMDEDEIDMKTQWINANMNTGILSALLLTVWVTFLQQATDISYNDDSALALAYIISWSCSIVFTLASVVICVFTLIAIEETSGSEEVHLFLNMFGKRTLGLGPILPLLTLFLGSSCAIAGILCWLLIFFGTLKTIIGFLAMCISFFYGFIVFYLFMVSSLQASRQTSQFLQHYKKEAVLTLEEGKDLLYTFKNEQCRGTSLALKHPSKFLDYVLEDVVKRDMGNELTHQTKVMLTRLYECYLEASIFEEIDVRTFDVQRWNAARPPKGISFSH